MRLCRDTSFSDKSPFTSKRSKRKVCHCELDIAIGFVIMLRNYRFHYVFDRLSESLNKVPLSVSSRNSRVFRIARLLATRSSYRASVIYINDSSRREAHAPTTVRLRNSCVSQTTHLCNSLRRDAFVQENASCRARRLIELFDGHWYRKYIEINENDLGGEKQKGRAERRAKGRRM